MAESFREIREKLFLRASQTRPGEGWKEIVRTYLSVEHFERPHVGCPIAALAPDLARVKPSVKRRMARVIEQHRNELMPFFPGQNAAEKEKNFILAITAMAGAVSFARTLTDYAAQQKVLETMREHLLGTL